MRIENQVVHVLSCKARFMRTEMFTSGPRILFLTKILSFDPEAYIENFSNCTLLKYNSTYKRELRVIIGGPTLFPFFFFESDFKTQNFLGR